MFGPSRQYAIHPEWVSQTIQRIREDEKVALHISTLIDRINGASHVVLLDNGEKVPLGQYTDIEQLIDRHVQKPSEEGVLEVGARILHYQRGGLTPFCHIYSEKFIDYGNRKVTYEKDTAHLAYKELSITDSQTSKGYEGTTVAGQYMVLDPRLQTSLAQVFSSNGINIEDLSSDQRVIITQDYFTNRAAHIFDEKEGKIISFLFGPRKLH